MIRFARNCSILQMASVGSTSITSLLVYHRLHHLWHTLEIIAWILFTSTAILGAVCSKKISLTILMGIWSLGPIRYTHDLWRALAISNTSIMMMAYTVIVATITYWVGDYHHCAYPKVASWLTWLGVMMGIIGLGMRWHASYLLSPDIGHVPISNLYEVLTLFIITTSLLYLLIEESTGQLSLGCFVMIIVSLMALFLIWYAHRPHAKDLSILVPALQSNWMILHVPANFVGYGLFVISAMLSMAYVCKNKDRCSVPSAIKIASLIYQSIAVGFMFFTVAIMLGALWAAETWGSYWQWDPKETWSLIVWLNYAAWLHQRRKSALFTHSLAWWSWISLFVIGFAFLGVNIVLSGLHSYGELT